MSEFVARGLNVAGHDVEWVGSWTSDPGDAEILKKAFDDARVLITLDKNFGELAVVKGLPHSGIIRLVRFSIKNQVAACLRILSLHEKELQKGAIVTAEPGRLRIRSQES